MSVKLTVRAAEPPICIGPLGPVTLAITGASLRTVNVVLHVALLPQASVAVTTILVGPIPTMVPGDGDCVIVTLPPQLSVAVTPTVTQGTAAVQPAPARAVVGDGHPPVNVGAVVSLTMIVWLRFVTLPQASVA